MKKVVIFIAITIIMISACSVTFAKNPSTTPAFLKVNPDTFKPTQEIAETGKFVDRGQKIVQIINTIGTIVLIATVGILGIIYMTGSVEQKADYKGRMIPVIIGAVLLFALSTVINFVYTVVTQ